MLVTSLQTSRTIKPALRSPSGSFPAQQLGSFHSSIFPRIQLHFIHGSQDSCQPVMLLLPLLINLTAKFQSLLCAEQDCAPPPPRPAPPCLLILYNSTVLFCLWQLFQTPEGSHSSVGPLFMVFLRTWPGFLLVFCSSSKGQRVPDPYFHCQSHL